MKLQLIPFNNAEERLNTLRPKHWAALQNILTGMPGWDEQAFTNALNALGWTDRRVPLNILQAERSSWEQSYQPCPYGKVSYPAFSYEWLQETKTAFFMFCRRFGIFADKTGRFSYAGKKGMALAWASGNNVNHILRLACTDFPLLYDMDKLGVGFLLIYSCPPHLIETLKKTKLKNRLPFMVLILS